MVWALWQSKQLVLEGKQIGSFSFFEFIMCVIICFSDQMNDQNKFCYMLTCPQVARIVGQFIIDAFDARPVP